MKDSHNKIRVWAIFRYYYPNFAGAAVQGHRILSRLVDKDFSVEILAAADQEAAALARQTIVMDGLRIHYLPVLRLQSWDSLSKFRCLRKFIRFLNSLASNFSLNVLNAWILWRYGNRGDIVQLYSCNEFSFLTISIARFRGMHPVIRMTLVGSMDDPRSHLNNTKNVFGKLILKAFRESEAIVSISSALTESCHSAGFDLKKVVQIPNGVDLQRFQPLNDTDKRCLQKALKLRPDQRYIVFVGAAQHRKGIDILIRAFIQVAREISDVELLIVGPCDFSDSTRYLPERQELLSDLRKETESAKITSRVHWIGEVNNVHEYLQAADIFCLPTRREGLGTAIMEAMAVGLPTVTARLHGVTTDLITSESDGILISDNNPESYKDAILRLLRKPSEAKQLGEAARKRAMSELDIELISQQYALIYRKLVHGD